MKNFISNNFIGVFYFISSLVIISFLGCNSDDLTELSDEISKRELKISKFHEGDPHFIKEINSGNERSNYSTKVIYGMDWPGQPFFGMIGPTGGSYGGYSFGNTIPSNSSTACMVVGNLDGVLNNQLMIGYNSPEGPLIIKMTGPYLLSNSNYFYIGSSFWTLIGVAAIDFNGDGSDELITAFNSPLGPALYRGKTSIGVKIYQGPPSLSIVAIAAGDFNGNGKEELVTAFNSSNGPSLYKSTNGFDIGSIFYQGSAWWELSALTAADFNDNGQDELIVGFNSPLGPALYKNNTSSIGTKIYQGSTVMGKLSALTSGRFDASCLMHIGFTHPTSGAKIYVHDGYNLGSVVLSAYSSSGYEIKALASGEFSPHPF